jgi:hypothetical protein
MEPARQSISVVPAKPTGRRRAPPDDGRRASRDDDNLFIPAEHAMSPHAGGKAGRAGQRFA